MFEISTLEQGSQKDYPKLAAGFGQGGKGSRKVTFILELQPQPAPLSFQESLRHPWPDPKTMAGGIADDILFDGHTVLPALRTTGGAAVTVEEGEIEAAALALARQEGVLCEPTAAVAVAALSKLPGAGPDTRVCCLVTGNGLKDIAFFQERTPGPVPVRPALEDVRKALED